MRLPIFFLILTIITLNTKIQAKTYNLSSIDIGYGVMDISSGYGHLKLDVNSKNELDSISIDVEAGVLGIYERIVKSQSVSNLKSGGSIKFFMREATQPILKIYANKEFTEKGGTLKIEVRKKNYFEKTTFKLLKDPLTKKFKIYDLAGRIVSNLKINMRGLTTKTMYVGFYEFN